MKLENPSWHNPINTCYSCGGPNDIQHYAGKGGIPLELHNVGPHLRMRCADCATLFVVTLRDDPLKSMEPVKVYEMVESLPHCVACQCSLCKWLETHFSLSMQKDVDRQMKDKEKPANKIIQLPKRVAQQAVRCIWDREPRGEVVEMEADQKTAETRSPQQEQFRLDGVSKEKEEQFFKYPQEKEKKDRVDVAELLSKKRRGMFGGAGKFPDWYFKNHPAYKTFSKWASKKTHCPQMPSDAEHMEGYSHNWMDRWILRAEEMDEETINGIIKGTSYGVDTAVQCLSRQCIVPPKTGYSGECRGADSKNFKVWEEIRLLLIGNPMPENIKLPKELWLDEHIFREINGKVFNNTYMIPIRARVETNNWLVVSEINPTAPTHHALSYMAYKL